jgi:AsmA family protein
LYIQGTFKKPDVGVDKGVIALKGGAAVALGAAAAPFAALLALINPGPGQDSPCGFLLAEAKEKPKAPPPGKTKAPEP